MLIALRTDLVPRKPAEGTVCGWDTTECDIYLGKRKQGVGRRQFRFTHNSNTGVLVLINLGSNGTRYENSKTGEIDQIWKSKALVPGDQIRIYVGVHDYTLRVPLRSEEDQAKFDVNLERIRKSHENTRYPIQSLSVHSGIDTPAVVETERPYIYQNQIGRGEYATVYKVVDAETGEFFAAKHFDDRERENNIHRLRHEGEILKSLQHVSSLHEAKDCTKFETGERCRLCGRALRREAGNHYGASYWKFK